MTDLVYLLHAAADDAPRGDLLLPAVQGFAHRRRRRQVAATSLAAVMVLLSAASLSGLVPRPLNRYLEVTSGSGSSDGARCNGGYARPVSAASVADSVALLSADKAFTRLGPIYARMMRWDCARPGVPINYRQDADGKVTRAFTVSGPSPGFAPGVTTYDPAPKRVAVRGTSGELRVSDSERRWLQWQEPGGSAWRIDASGLTTRQVLAIANGLRLGKVPSADPATVPKGMSVQDAVPAMHEGEHPFFVTDYLASRTDLNVQVWERNGSLTREAAGWPGPVAVVDVNGHEALLNHSTADGVTTTDLLWERRPGIWASVMAPTANDALVLSFARSLEPVKADDPRLSDVQASASPPPKQPQR